MGILIQIKAVLVGTILLLFVLVPACIIALPLPLSRRLKIVGPAWAFFGRNIVRYACHAKIAISEDHRSPQYRGVPCSGLYIANHQGYVDIPMMVTLFQAPPIMKKEVLYLPVIGWMSWISGALPVSRNKSSSRREVFEKAKKRVLKDNIGLQVYPEGTRSKDALPKPYSQIKRTLLVFAYNEKIAVIPVSVYGTRGIIGTNGLIRPNRNVGIIVHKELLPVDFPTAEAFAQACWNKVIEGHDAMKAQLGPLNESLSLA